jgi:hypothetical protein
MATAGKSNDSASTDERSSSFGAGSSYIAPMQQGYLQQIYGAGSQLAMQQQPQVAAYTGGQGANALEQGRAFLEQLSGQAGGSNQFLGQLRDFRPDYSAGQTAVQPVIDQLGRDITQQLGRQVSGAGGINSQEALAGNLGGGRNQVRAGIADEAALQTFGREAANLRYSAGSAGVEQQLRAALGGGQLEAQDVATRGALSQAGIGGAQSVFNMGLSPFSAQFGPLQAYAALLGGPTVLQSQFDQSQSQRTSRSQGSSREFGISPIP